MKDRCIKMFNKIVNKNPVDFQNELLPLISDYLTEINYEKSTELINLIINNPQLANQTISELIDYYIKKYNILYISDKFKNPILYYD